MTTEPIGPGAEHGGVEPGEAREVPTTGFPDRGGASARPLGAPLDGERRRELDEAGRRDDVVGELDELGTTTRAGGIDARDAGEPIDDDDARGRAGGGGRDDDADETEPIAEPETPESAVDDFLEWLSKDELPDSGNPNIGAQAILLLNGRSPQELLLLRESSPDKQREVGEKITSVYRENKDAFDGAIQEIEERMKALTETKEGKEVTQEEARRIAEEVGKSFWERNPKFRKTLKGIGWTTLILTLLIYAPAFATLSWGGGGQRR